MVSDSFYKKKFLPHGDPCICYMTPVYFHEKCPEHGLVEVTIKNLKVENVQQGFFSTPGLFPKSQVRAEVALKVGTGEWMVCTHFAHTTSVALTGLSHAVKGYLYNQHGLDFTYPLADMPHGGQLTYSVPRIKALSPVKPYVQKPAPKKAAPPASQDRLLWE